MKIGTINQENKLDHIPNKVTYVENVLIRIGNLLKGDDQTIIGPKLKKVEEMEIELLKEELKLNTLLDKSIDIEKETKEKLGLLNSENIVIRKKLIEMIGDEK
jgi:hypothetical protein